MQKTVSPIILTGGVVCKTVEEQEMKRSELVAEIKDFEFTDIYTCQEKICKIEDEK